MQQLQHGIIQKMGEHYILEYHQGLWFGEKLPNSLINPNQSRVYGISLCDDPFDPFGIGK
jgi:hypothetical protein